jgi:hypothetical protein
MNACAYAYQQGLETVPDNLFVYECFAERLG